MGIGGQVRRLKSEYATNSQIFKFPGLCSHLFSPCLKYMTMSLIKFPFILKERLVFLGVNFTFRVPFAGFFFRVPFDVSRNKLLLLSWENLAD